MRKAKILVYVSSATAVPYREGGTHPVGVFLGELTEPLEPMLAAGHEITFVSPDGRGPHIDKNSFRLMYWRFNRRKMEHARRFYEEKLIPLGIETPYRLGDVLAKPGDLLLPVVTPSQFDSLFVPGGHAPMTDILYKNWLEGEEINEQTGWLLRHFHDNQKPTVLICHAPSALAAAQVVNGKWQYEGYSMTCVNTLSEFLIEEVWPFKVMHGHLPDYPQRILEKKGGRLRQCWVPMLSHVVEDRELLTGQDPYAAVELGKRWKTKLDQYLAAAKTA